MMKTKAILAAVFFLGLILRLYNLAGFPPSLNWDEASLGYNAFTISQSLRDEHGTFLPVTNFPAFGDYKPPGYIYAAVPFVKAFGLTEFSVRLPSALAGTSLVLMTYFLVLELLFLKRFQISPASPGSPRDEAGTGRANFKFKIAAAAALFVAISPWSLQMSRAAFEANFATFLTALGAVLFVRALRLGKTSQLVLCAAPFSLAIYTFNSHRVFVPILISGLLLIFFRRFISHPKMLIFFILVLAVLNAPLLPHLSSKEGRLRFNEVTWLNDLDLVKESNTLIAKNGNTFLANIIFNRRVLYGREFIKHYLDHLGPKFLFISGDINPRLSTQSTGELYFWDGVFFIFGLLVLLKFRSKMSAIIFFWSLTALIPAAVAKQTPHALRTLNILPMPQITISFGLCWLMSVTGRRSFPKTILAVIVSVLYFLSFQSYLGNYYLAYPAKYADSWQYGYKQLVQHLATVEKNYDRIHVTNLYGRPYIYFLFHKKYPLDKFLKTRDASVDEFGFWSVKSFDKYIFSDIEAVKGKWLFVTGPSKNPQNRGQQKVISGLDGKTIFEISESK